MRLRTELKFVVHHSVQRLLLERWRRYLAPAPFTDRHATTPVLSQYYDSPDLRYVREKLDGIGFRNKVRLRVYAMDFAPGAAAFLEIKWRHNERVFKRRQRLDPFHPDQLEPAAWRFDDAEMQGAFRFLLLRHGLRPSARVYYQREAWQGGADRDLRVTFDRGLIALRPRETLSRAILRDPRRRLLADTLAILEVKSTAAPPPWVHEGIVAAELQQRTVPKYVSAVEHLGLAGAGAGGAEA